MQTYLNILNLSIKSRPKCDISTNVVIHLWLAAGQPVDVHFYYFQNLTHFLRSKTFQQKKLFSRLFERTEMCFGAQEPQPLKIRHNHLFIDNLDFLLRLGRRIFGHWTGRWAWAWVRGLIEAKYRDIDPLCVVNFALFFFLLSLFVSLTKWQNVSIFDATGQSTSNMANTTKVLNKVSYIHSFIQTLTFRSMISLR